MKSIILTIIVLVAAATASGESPITTLKDLKESGSRIINGQKATVGQFPWQVANKIHLGIFSSFCGGALICDRWVLTAAHCVQGASSFTISLGSVNQSQAVEAGRVVINTRRAIVHEKYSSTNLNNDIALIDLGQRVNFTDNIQPIRLGESYTGNNLTLTVSGWGKTSDGPGSISPQLNWVNLTSISNQQCADVYGSSIIINSTLCCQGKSERSPCNGDDGGPLVQLTSNGYEHVGVVSFVSSAGCASDPSGYVRTSSYHDWIVKNINGTCTLP